MARKRIDVRLPEEQVEWLAAYAAERGVDRTSVLETALQNLREEAAGGVPDVISRKARQRELIRKAVQLHGKIEGAQGVGDCPERPGELGHIWEHKHPEGAPPFTVCGFCGLLGKEFFERATAERTELFSTLRAPASSRGGAPKR